MFFEMENLVTSQIEWDFEREERAVRFFENRIRNEIPAFNTQIYDPVEFKKVMTWIARYGLHLADKYNLKEIVYPRPEKGLLINGRTGRGKSTIAGLISVLFRNVNYEDKIPFYTLNEIDKAWGGNPKECESDFPAAFDSKQTVVIDDVGAEGMTKRFGNEPVFDFLIQHFYDSWKYRRKLIVMTSNLSTYDAPEMANNNKTYLGVYGERINSRGHEMFEIVRINGENDLRKNGKPEVIPNFQNEGNTEPSEDEIKARIEETKKYIRTRNINLQINETA